MTEKASEPLKQFLELGKDWERRSTSIPGVFIMKLPSYRKNISKLSVEINPVDTYGNPTKKRGLLIRNKMDLENYRELLKHEKLEALIETIGKVNPPTIERGKTKSDLIEL